MQSLRTLLLVVQKFTAVNRKTLIGICIGIEILLFVFGVYVMTNAAKLYALNFFALVDLGSKLGVAALSLYVATLLPSIITRLQWYPLVTQPFASILLPFRRHFGNMMFIAAWLHMSLTTTLPQLVNNGFDTSKIELLLFQWMGQIAWWLLFPLWITSNDLSQRFMGKWWKRIHKLTYIAMFFIFLHVALLQEGLVIVIGSVVVLEVLSWIAVRKRSRLASGVAVSQPPVSTADPQAVK